MNPLTPYPITPIGCFLGFVLAVVPLPLQLQSWNIGVFMYGVWVALFNLQMFVNTIIWRDNVNIVAPVWCDIATRITVGVTPAIRGCTLAICIRLYKITRSRTSDLAYVTANKRKAVILDLFLTFALPLILMGLQIIVQPIRFEILEEIGCSTVVFSFVGYIIDFLPEVVLSAATLCMAIGTIRVFLAHRKEMSEFLSSDPSMQSSRYKRLIAIASLDTAFNVPIMLTSICKDVIGGDDISYNYPYIGWSHVHDGAGGLLPGTTLSTILQVPASDWSTDKWEFFSVKWNVWVYVLHAVVFFAVFGTTPEMMRRYRKAFWFMPEGLGFTRKGKVEEAISEIKFHSGVPAGHTVSGGLPSVGPINTGMDIFSVSMPTTDTTTGNYYPDHDRSKATDEDFGAVDVAGTVSLKLKTALDLAKGGTVV